jgi:hemolysin III
MPLTHSQPSEELANSITHGFGAVLSLIAGLTLIILAAQSNDPWRIISAAVFSSSLLLLYTASAVYHSVPNGPTKARLEILDHCAIFLLIAGTYTPFTLVTLRGVWGWSLFGVVWGLAAAGIALKQVFSTRVSLLSTLIYIGMGWLVVVAAGPMIEALPRTTVLLLVAGGVTYTAGTLFYHNHRIPYAHAIWHLFVLGGSVLHYLAVATQVVS